MEEGQRGVDGRGAVLCGSSGGGKGRNMSSLRSIVWETNARATGAKKNCFCSF